MFVAPLPQKKDESRVYIISYISGFYLWLYDSFHTGSHRRVLPYVWVFIHIHADGTLILPSMNVSVHIIHAEA